MKPTNPENERVINALMAVGYTLGYARSIVYGAKQMKDLQKAKELEKAPHFISTEIWDYLYKGEKDK